MGRTPGALNKNNRGEEGLDFDNTTIIEGSEPKPKKDGRGRPAGGGKVSVEKETIADKLNILCEGIASILGFQYEFNAIHFYKEATALANIAKIYPPVAKVLEFFDPLLIVFGIFSKFKGMKKKDKKKEPQNVPRETMEQNQQSNLTLMKMG
jgi:hypothetical protein